LAYLLFIEPCLGQFTSRGKVVLRVRKFDGQVFGSVPRAPFSLLTVDTAAFYLPVVRRPRGAGESYREIELEQSEEDGSSAR
jgi:hypothetical protein